MSWASQFNGAWSPPTVIETADANSAFGPALGTDGNNNAVAAWYYGTSFDVYANVLR